MINIKDNILCDIRFDGEACAISTSATSIMIRTLLNKTVDEALHIIDEYEKMIDEQEYDPNVLGEATVYDEIYKQPNRKKCALLPVKGIKKVLGEHKDTNVI
jgi:nitrogen fixation NifU-like protein